MKATVLVSNGGKAYSKQVIEVLPDASSATIGQVATVTAGGTVAFVDPFLKSGGTIAGNLNLSAGQYQINGLTAIYDNGGIWGNLRVVGNMSGFNNDGIYLGYNQSNAPVRLYDGGVANYLNLVGATFSSVGINKWLFGSQSDDGTFAQFSGAVKIKNDLTVTGTNGTFSTNSVQSNLYYLNLTRSSIALSTVGYAGFGTSNPLAPTHSFGGTAMTAGWNKTSILQATYPVQVFNSNGTKWAGIGYDNGYGMRFWVNATSEDVSGTGLNALTILNNGYAGFGVTPQYQLDVNGTANVSQLRLRTVTYPIAQDLGGDNVYMNTRVIQNVGGVSDGMYIGYSNNGYGANRIYDGGGSNYLRIGSATFSSLGISKWLFGDQSDNGKYAQFVGEIHAKAGLTVDGAFSYGGAGTRTELLNNAGEMGGKSGFFETFDPINFPAGASSWWHLISARHSNTGNNYAMQIAGSFFDQRIYFRKTNNAATQVWREFLSADMAGNTIINNKLTVSGATALSWSPSISANTVFGTGGTTGTSLFINTPSLNTGYHSGLAIDGSYTNPIGVGSSIVNIKALGVNSAGGYDSILAFHTTVGTTLYERLRIIGNGYVGFGLTNPQFRIDNNGDINTSGAYYLSGLVSNWFDGTYIRYYKRNGNVAFSIANNATYYDNDYHIFRKPDGTEKFTVDTGNDRILTYTSKHLFGSQSDDGTANQFAGAIKAKSDLIVAGISYLAATRLSSYLVMNNYNFLWWKDAGGTDRRFLGFSSPNFYMGDTDNTISGSNNLYMANAGHYWYLNGSQKMTFTASGLVINNSLSFEGSVTSPIRTISGGTATYTINSTDNVVIITTSPGSSFTIDAPTTSNKGRELVLKNISIASQTLSQNYINLSGSSTNQIPNNQSIRLKYNGSDIHQI